MICDRCGKDIDDDGVLVQWGSITKRLLCKPCFRNTPLDNFINMLFMWGDSLMED